MQYSSESVNKMVWNNIYLNKTMCWCHSRGVYHEPRWTYPGFLGKTCNSQSELNGTTKLTLDSISWTRFSALGSVRVHLKGAFFASFFSPLR
jgi:hypothetical protein